MKRPSLFLLAFLLISCGKKGLMLDEYYDYKMTVETKKYESPLMNYSMQIPASWKEMGIGDDEPLVETFLDTTSLKDWRHDTNFCSIHVITFKDTSATLKELFDVYLGLFNKQKTKKTKLIESGKTDFLRCESYFIHYKANTATPAGEEDFSFLVKAKEDSMYYSLDISVPQYKKTLKDNVGMLLTCIRSFEMR
jgi:hypothetical protein